MQWLNDLPFADNRVLQIGLLLACGIAALIVLAIAYRVAFGHRLRVPGGRTRQPRLGLVDAFSLDGQRQLVLVRRDNVEHLVMIGGPNDVLVKSQINRAVTPARENAQTSPLLVPSSPVRQAPLPAPAPAPVEAPAKTAAKVPVPTPPSAPVPAAPPAPAAPAPIPAAAPPGPPAAPPSMPKAPAPAEAPAPGPVQAPTHTLPRPIEPERARPTSSPPAAAQMAETARPAPASPLPARQGEPRPAQPRPTQPPRATMPPPILPHAAASRAAPIRATETSPARSPANPPAPPASLAPMPARRPEKPEPAVTKPEPAIATSKAEPVPATVKTEPPAGPTVSTVPRANSALAQTGPAPKTPPLAAGSNPTQKPAEARPSSDKANPAPTGKPPQKVDDPFADLDSLEVEMARLLGREKSD